MSKLVKTPEQIDDSLAGLIKLEKKEEDFDTVYIVDSSGSMHDVIENQQKKQHVQDVLNLMKANNVIAFGTIAKVCNGRDYMNCEVGGATYIESAINLAKKHFGDKNKFVVISDGEIYDVALGKHLLKKYEFEPKGIFIGHVNSMGYKMLNDLCPLALNVSPNEEGFQDKLLETAQLLLEEKTNGK